MKFKVSSIFCKQRVVNKRKKNNLLQAISLICTMMGWNVVLFLWFLHYFQTFWLQSWISCQKLKEKEPGTEAVKQKGTNNSWNEKFTSRFWDSQAEGYPASEQWMFFQFMHSRVNRRVGNLSKCKNCLKTDRCMVGMGMVFMNTGFPQEHGVSLAHETSIWAWLTELQVKKAEKIISTDLNDFKIPKNTICKAG